MSPVHMQAIDKTHSSHDVEKALLIIQDNIIKGFEREHARLIPRLYPIKSGTRGGSNAHNISLRKSPRLNSRLVSPMTTDLSQFGSVFSRNLHTSGSAGSNSNIGTHSTHLKPGTPAISAWMLPPSTTTSNIPPNNSRTRSAHTPHWERLYSAHTSKVKQRELLANVAEEQRRLAEERSCTFKPNVSPLRMHSKSAEPFTVGRSTAVHQRLFVDAKRLKVRSPGRYESESAENCTNQWASSLRGVASKAKRISEGREHSNNEHHRSNSKLRTKKSSQNLIGGGSIIVHRTADAWGRLFDEAKDRAERKKAKDKGPEESTSTSTKQISKKDTDALVYRLVRDVQSREQRLQERREAVEKRREEALRRDMYAARCKTPQRSHSAFRKHPPHSAHPDASNRSKTEITFDYGSNAVKDNNFAVPPEFDMNFNDEDADWNLIKDLSFGNRHDLPSSRLDLTEDSPRTQNDRDILNVDESKTSVPVKTTIPPVIPTLRLPSRLPDLSILDSNNQMSTDTEKASEDVGTYDYMEYFEHFSKEENALPH